MQATAKAEGLPYRIRGCHKFVYDCINAAQGQGKGKGKGGGGTGLRDTDTGLNFTWLDYVIASNSKLGVVLVVR